MAHKRLRRIERIVLRNLELDARVPFSRLGKKIRKSQQQVSYTVNSMVEKGIIRGFYAIVDNSILGALKFRVYFKVSYRSKERYEDLIEYLVSEPYTSWVAACGGRYDLICTFFALNPSQFNKKLKAIMARFPRQLENYTVLTTVVNRKFVRKYLFEQRRATPELVFGGDAIPQQVDETDMRIMDELSADARKSSVEISRMLDVTPKTVIERIKRLQARKIIIGFRPFINPREMGYIPILLMIKYHNITPEMEDELIRYLKAHPNVTWAVKTLGEWDIEIALEARDLIELRSIEMGIRQRFVAMIHETETIPVYKNHKKNLFPRFLISEKK